MPTAPAAITAAKPSEFGSAGEDWSQEGWLVRVNWQPLRQALVPKTFFELGSQLEHQPDGPPKPNLAQTPCRRQPCSCHWLDGLDRRQHADQILLGQLQIMAPLHP
jgi:hypothetical protein